MKSPMRTGTERDYKKVLHMKLKSCQKGLTLIELLIAMGIGGVVLAAALAAFWNMQSTSTSVDQRSNMLMNARGGMAVIEDHIRSAGFDPEGDMGGGDIVETASGSFFDFNRSDLEEPTDDSKDKTIGIGLKSSQDSDDGGRDGFADNGATSLTARINGSELDIADNIAAVRFAYAYDDGSGDVELSSNENVIWAIDSNGDGNLDTELDTNDDGRIDKDDDEGGSSMTGSVDISEVKAVRVWLLARTPDPVRGASDNTTYVVGDQRFTPDDDFGYTLFETSVRCRNMN